MNEGDVDVLCCDVDRLSVADSEISQTLSAEERRRAERFKFPELAHRYRTGRYMLRRALSGRTGGRPSEFRFVIGEQGKPYLPDGPAFNLSDSRSLVLIGLAAGGNLGVDVEHVVASRDLDSLSRRYFSAEERRSLEQLPAEARVRGFYRVWTRKEAFMKAVGLGLALPLDSFVVSAFEADENALLRGNSDFSHTKWFVQSVVVGPDCEAAIAWDCRPGKLEVRHFPALA